MRIGVRRRASAAVLATVSVVGIPATAHATGITEFPDNGSEQGGRGGAWIARASDPLAAFYNPAGLAGQPTRLALQSNINFQSTCFTRYKALNDLTSDPDLVKPGQYYPKVCSQDGAGIVPQLALTYRISDRIGLGIAPLMTPSGGASNISFPSFVSTTNSSSGKTIYEPGPERYLLTSATLVVVTPTIGIGVEVVDRLRLGVSFEWGIASLSFTNSVAATANTAVTSYLTNSEVQATASVHNYFIPGLTAGAIYSPSDSFDIAAWYKWAAPIDGVGDITTTLGYYSPAVAEGKPASPGSQTITSQANCGNAMAMGQNATLCGSGNNLHITVAQPMEAKIGFRYHKLRSDVPYDEHVRDPMAQDVFDIEADLTWANNSTFQNLQVRLPGNSVGDGTIPINGVAGAFGPPNADVAHDFHDVYGIRLGGDVNVVPDALAIRGGAFFQSSALTAQDQNIDFPASTNFGLALGGTYRIHLSKVKTNALELSLGYEHVFYMNESYTGTGGVEALAGTPCSGSNTETPNYTCSNNVTRYRSPWAVNLGTITNSINVLNVGLGYKF